MDVDLLTTIGDVVRPLDGKIETFQEDLIQAALEDDGVESAARRLRVTVNERNRLIAEIVDRQRGVSRA